MVVVFTELFFINRNSRVRDQGKNLNDQSSGREATVAFPSLHFLHPKVWEPF